MIRTTSQPPAPTLALLPPVWPLSTLVRPLQFMLTGCLAGLLQICVMEALTGRGWPSLAANIVAALCGAQLNFALSSVFTWRDRVPASVWRRWLLYHGTIAGTMLLSMVSFGILSTVVPDEAASAAGIALGGVANFFLGDRLVFRLHVKSGAADGADAVAA